MIHIHYNNKVKFNNNTFEVCKSVEVNVWVIYTVEPNYRKVISVAYIFCFLGV